MKPRTTAALLLAFFSLSGSMFLWLAGFEFYSWSLLRQEQALIHATVTDTRINPCTGRGCSGVPPYQVRYQFSPPGQAQSYTYTSQWLVRESWVRVPKAVYLQAQGDHTIEVAYAAADARINRPSSQPAKSASEWLIFGCFALLSFGVGWGLYATTKASDSPRPTPVRGSRSAMSKGAMSGIGNSRTGSWHRLAASIGLARLWLLAHSRPQFHYAAEVLFQTAYYGAVLGLTVLALNLFDSNVAIDFDLVAHLVGPLGAGALAAGLVRGLFGAPSPMRGWCVAATYGGVAGLVFAILVDLRWRGPTLPGAACGLVLGAGFFALLHWLYELEARKQS